jgi:O-antigen/teichoic acid export membrane protein
VASVFGFGLASPVEQLVTRRLNVGAPHAVRRPLLLLVAAALVLSVLAVVLGSHAAAALAYPQLVPAVVGTVLGWTAVAAVRGRLAGAGDLAAYGGVLVVESGTRVLLVAAAVLDRPHAAVLLGAATGLPLLLAAGLGAQVHPGERSRSAQPEDDVVRAEQLSFTAVSLGLQICLNAPPLLLEWRVGPGAAVGAFVVANSYYRIPTVLIAGVSTPALVSLSHAWGDRDLTRFWAVLSRALRTMAVLAAGATGLTALASPWLLPLYNGGPLLLPGLILVGMGVSTVVAVIAAVLAQPLLAAGRGRSAAAAWMAGALVTCAFLALAPGTTGPLVPAGLVAGPSVALLGAVLFVRRLRPAPSTVDDASLGHLS